MLCFRCQVTAPLGTAHTSQVATGNSLPHSGYMTLTGLRTVILVNIPLLQPPKEEILISTPALQVAKKTRPNPCPRLSGPTTHQGLGLVSALGVHSRSRPWAEGTDIKGCRAQKWDAGVLGDTYG